MRHTLFALTLAFLSVQASALEMLDRIAAVVNDGVIMESELNQRVDSIEFQLRMEGQRVPPRNILREQLIERMVVEEIQMQLAERGGIRIDDSSLNQAISGIARQNDLTLDQMAAAMREDGLSWAEFREQIRREMTMNQLHQRQVGPRVRITDREVERFLSSEFGRQLFESEFRLGHILISTPDGATPVEIDQAREKAEALVARVRAGESFRELAVSHSDGQQALEGGDLGWRPAARLPTLFSENAANLQPGEVSNPLRAPNGFHILLMIDRRGGATQLIEQYQVRHILVSPGTLRSQGESERLARRLRQRIEEGESMATLAREHSDDPGSARDGGMLGWVSPGEMVDAFEHVMLRTPENELSEAFQTQFGWHVLRVEDTRTADVSEDFRQLRARQALHQRRFDEELQQWIREKRNESYVDIRI